MIYKCPYLFLIGVSYNTKNKGYENVKSSLLLGVIRII